MWLPLRRALITGWLLRRTGDHVRIICARTVPVPMVLRCARMALVPVITGRRCVPTVTVPIGRSRAFCVFDN